MGQILDGCKQFIISGDLLGAADYLSQIKFDDPEKKRKANDLIIGLRRQGRIYNSIMSKAGENRDAVAFKFAMDSHFALPGTDDEPNQYSEKFRELANNIGGEDSDWVEIRFEGKTEKKYGLFGIDWLAADEEHEDDAFSLFCHQNNYTRDTFKSDPANFKLEERDGRTYLKVRKGSDGFIDVVRGLRNVDDNHTVNKGQLDQYERGNARYGIKGYKTDNNGALVPVTGAGANTLDRHLRLVYSERYNGMDDENYQNPDYTRAIKDGVTGSSNGISELNNFLDDVYDKANEAIPEFSEDAKVETDTIVSSFMTAGHADAFALHARGVGTDAEYKSAQEMLVKQLNNDLLATGFHAYKIYATEEGDVEGVMEELDTKGRESLQTFAEAAVEKNIVSYNAAMLGDKLGTMVTIAPEMDDKHKIKGKGRKFFIEGWRKDDAEKLFNRDTKTRATLEYNAMKMYGYESDVADGRISMAADSQAMFTDKDGNTEAISAEKAQWYLNKQYFLDDMVEQALTSEFNEDGSLKTRTPNVVKKVEDSCLAAATELYPKAASELSSTDNDEKENAVDFLKARANELAVYILRAIGVYKDE